MFLHLSKKIAIPNQVVIHSLAFSRHGWIACGADTGMLKIFKIETDNHGLSAINISSNQTLNGHNSPVTHLVWNDKFRKLASSDNSGLIIVWALHKDKTWCEEMINNRNKSAVCVLQWSKDGESIVIGYEDGVVTVGSVNGTRLWSKNVGLKLVSGHWVENQNFLLCSNNNILVFYHGTKIKQWTIDDILPENEIISNDVVSLCYPTSSQNCIATMAVVTRSGDILLFRYPFCERALVVKSDLVEIRCSWNDNGTILAAGGTKRSDDTPETVIKCYDIEGKQLSFLQLPGEIGLKSIIWEGSHRLLFTIGSNIYFALIRHDDLWTRLGSTVIFANLETFGSTWTNITFWNIYTNQIDFIQKSYLFKGLASGGDRVAFIQNQDSCMHACNVHLCDELGGTVSIMSFDIRPLCFTMDNNNIIISDGKKLLLWNFSSLDGKDQIIKQDLNDSISGDIVALTTSPSGKVVAARMDSTIELIDVKTSLTKQLLKVDTFAPTKIRWNFNCSRLLMFNSQSTLFVFDMNNEMNPYLMFHKTKCLDAIWNTTTSDLFALRDKDKVCIYQSSDSKPKIIDSKKGFSFFSYDNTLVQINLPLLFSASHPYSTVNLFDEIKGVTQ